MTTRQYRDRTKHQNGASITNSSVSLTAGALLQGQGLSGATFPYTVAVYAQDLSGNLTSYEEMDVTGGTYPTLTVSRGINGTTAVAHDTTHIIAQVVGKNDCDNWLQAGNSIDIGSDAANIAKVNLTDQGSTPAAPASGHHIIYSKSGGLYLETSAGVELLLITSPMTTQDDLIVGAASGAPGRLGKGTDGQVLMVDPITHHLIWATPSAGFSNPMTTANDMILGGTAGAPTRLVSVAGKFLQTDGSGVVSWGSAPAPGSATLAGDSDVSISSPAAGQALTYNGSVWVNGSGTAIPAICQGRLTLTSGTAITTADVTAATTVYFTPYKGSQISTYSGTTWSTNAFTEKSASLSGLTASKNYDVFIVDGTLALELLVWTNDTTRATALVLQDGIYVKSGATTRRYLGTIRITATTGQCEDSVTHRFVWNYMHRFQRPLQVFDATDTWTYAVAAWRQARATATNQVDYVCGVSEDLITAEARATNGAGSGTAGAVGVGVDSTSTNSAQLFNESAATSGIFPVLARYRGFPGAGYHFLAWLEYARAGTVTFDGDSGVADQQSGMIADVWG